MQVTAELDCPLHDSFRVQQVTGMFDVPLHDRLTERFQAELPDDDDWQIGLIVGPSGSGKTSIARAAYGNRLVTKVDWPREQAVIDGFGDMPARDIVRLFTAVGFGSPPAWIKPYHLLSGGERFRCDLARALAGDEPVVAFDEFTTAVDRRAAQLASAAVARAIRKRWVTCRFVAVTCHDDVAAWLAPDWQLDMATGELQRRCLRRPTLEIQVSRCHVAAWTLFARHHYLAGSVSRSARCYAATWNEVPVAFCATLPLIGRRGRWRISRLVTLPEFQGLGIGSRLAAAVGDIHAEQGHRLSVTTSHPGFVAHARRSPDWRCTRLSKYRTRRRPDTRRYQGSEGRASISFEYVTDPGQSLSTD